MINIGKSPKHSGCLSCSSEENVKDIQIGANYVVTLCKKCRIDLLCKIADDIRQSEN